MRYIDPRTVKQGLPKIWKKSAKSAYAAIENLPPSKRKAYIKRNQKWQALSKILGDLFGGKCWYCESILKRSPTPVDHFRPKNNVKEAPKHGGYWWLAYEWDNYRFACTHCNTFGTAKKRGKAGGKNDSFPLINEKDRAKGPRSSTLVANPLDAEMPILLDPFKESDPGLLWFDENGTVCPHPIQCKNQKGVRFRRADESIKIYGLYQNELNELRAKHLGKISGFLRDADDYLIMYEQGNATAKMAHDKLIKNLKEAMSPKAEFSAAVRCFLMTKRATSDSAESALT